ncbi:unnamed protein product, partial [Rotaria sp. Silwood2]
ELKDLENPAFISDPPSTLINIRDEIMLTTKLQETRDKDDDDDDDDDDKNNSGFEKLSDEGHGIGLFLLQIRKKLIQIIKKQKTLTINGLKFMFIIGFLIYFGFAMSEDYGTPAFPIRGNIFHNNSGIIVYKEFNFINQIHLGFALFFFVIFAIFVFTWEKFLRRSIERLYQYISTSAEGNKTWNTTNNFMHRFSW